jgi:calcineurin-like phosphoesterase family protein
LRRAVTSGALTILMALVVVNAPFLAGTAIVLFLSGSFALDAIGYAGAAWRAAELRSRLLAIVAMAGDLSAAALLLAVRGVSATWLIAAACALRAFGVAWAMATSPTRTAEDAGGTVLDDLGLADHPDAAAFRAGIESEEHARAASDRRWVVAFIVTLFAIHIARMQADGSLLSLLAPAIAVLGDMLLASLFALVIIVPVVLSLRSSTRWLERRAWRWYLSIEPAARDWRSRLVAPWLRYRLRVAIGLREARYSVAAATRRSLATGLPVAAIVAATVPIWGMSWFFDTENWASGIWNSWAEARTDQWREAMATAVIASGSGGATPFLVAPPDTANGDFAFVVIGDTGEGDASQHVLRDQLLGVAARPEVRFIVISSDVVYPNGAMIDYEAKFWLPFKGVTKPIYAIPGNHDWYDGLDAFLATFLRADAARISMRARADSELRLTSTTSERIDGLIGEAHRLRAEYEVPTGEQRGPFFELQTDRFALVAIDTGIVKRIDRVQWAWLESALGRAAGKLTMAVVGHPFYAGGHDLTRDDEDFARLKRLLIDRGVAIVMAGDTHDLEYYVDPPSPPAPPVHYFVNGGGGAYMSFGTALAWPSKPATSEWAFYPNRDAVVAKIQARTPWWKRPAWWWTAATGAWPFSPEWLSAAFDYNVAPFFQSLVEVRVEGSRNEIHLIPYGVHGRLRWRDMAHSGHVAPGSENANEPVEWVVPMR